MNAHPLLTLAIVGVAFIAFGIALRLAGRPRRQDDTTPTN